MSKPFLRAALASAAVAATLVAGAAPAGAHHGTSRSDRPVTYVVPGANAFPEGSAADQRTGTFWISSVATGAIYRGTVDDPTLEVFLPAGSDGRDVAIGLE
jgi:Cu-Zn family superoxide dismutase